MGGTGGEGPGMLESDEAREKIPRRVIRGGHGRGSERVEREDPEDEEEFFRSL